MKLDNSNKSTGLDQLPLRGHKFGGGDINSNGRTCSQCRRFKPWENFSLKPKGLHGRDSRCRSCVVTNRKAKRKAVRQSKTTKQSRIDSCHFRSMVIGDLEPDVIQGFGQVLARGICDLLEKGELK